MKITLYLNNKLKKRLAEYSKLSKVSYRTAIKKLIARSVTLYYQDKDFEEFLNSI